MTRSLRRIHRVLFAGAVLVLPALYVLGVSSRPRLPPVAALPGAPAALPAGSTIVSTVEPKPGDPPLRVRWLRGPRSDGGQPLAIAIEVLGDPGVADLLLYWSGDDVQQRLPPTARLLGPVGSERTRSWVLPETEAASGSAVVYSLATQEVVAVFPLPAELSR